MEHFAEPIKNVNAWLEGSEKAAWSLREFEVSDSTDVALRMAHMKLPLHRVGDSDWGAAASW